MNQQVVTQEPASFPSNSAAMLYGISSNHENICKVEIGGELYKAIACMINAAVSKQKLASTPQDFDGKSLPIPMPPDSLAARSEVHIDGSVLDGWDIHSLRSHRSRMMQRIAGSSSDNASASDTP